MSHILDQVQDQIESLLPRIEHIYKDLHQNPELSMQEFRTSKIAADHLRDLGFEVSENLGITGVVGIMKNGDGIAVNDLVIRNCDHDTIGTRNDPAQCIGLSFCFNVADTIVERFFIEGF